MTVRSILAIAAAITVAPIPAGATQAAGITGRVIRLDTGEPIADAVVADLDRGCAPATTSSSGRFALGCRATRLVAVRLGFAAETVSVVRDRPVTVAMGPAALRIDELVVSAPRRAPGARHPVIDELDLALRPRESSQELLRLAPGLVVAQHAGGGKAEQVFLRGFDADHGTDVAVTVDGVPVNLVSHAHGQGYADLHFLLPELVERVEVRKGGHQARDGNLATAGAVALSTRDRIGRPALEVRGGGVGHRGATALLPLGGDRTAPGGYLALGALETDGPFEAPQRHRRLNGFARWTAPAGGGAEVVATASGFDARWNASGQIPERAVRRGLIGRFGAIDSTEGGTTSRYDLAVALRSTGPGARWELKGYATRYRLDLFSNFTFFAVDSLAGDGIEQVDRRTQGGLLGEWSAPGSILGVAGRTAAGFQLRLDRALVILADQTARVRRAVRVASRIGEANAGGWLSREATAGRLTLELGVRADLFRFEVGDLGGPAPGPRGTKWAARVSPKLALAFDLGRGLEATAGASRGFHSNDARDVVLADDPAATLPASGTVEAGVRRSWPTGTVGATIWRTDLDDELVFVGDEGVTEPSGRSRRRGFDLEGRIRLARWLWADADLSLAGGRLRDEPAGADRIPLAPTRAGTAGLTFRDDGPLGGSLRARHVGARPANEAGSVVARGATVTELAMTWGRGPVAVRAAVDNLFGVAWNEAQFATTSRLRGEPAAVTELHFTPGTPRRITVAVRLVRR